MRFLWGSSKKTVVAEPIEQTPTQQPFKLTQLRGNKSTKSWLVNNKVVVTDGQAYFDDSNGNRVYFIGSYILEPSVFVEIPESCARSHLVNVYDDGEIVRSFKVDLTTTTVANGQIWWRHPVTNLLTAITGTWVCAPLDLDIEELGHYKPDHFVTLFQCGKTMARWPVRAANIANDRATMWFDDDFSRLRVLTSGDIAYEPMIEADVIDPRPVTDEEGAAANAEVKPGSDESSPA